MAPARTLEEEDDPVTAEYDIYLTPQQEEQILLVQYPNRVRNRPYNARHGAMPEHVRMKPTTGFMEVDINLNTSFNFNKFRGLVWGDALSTARDVQNSTGTYGPAAGFAGAKPRAAGRTRMADQAERDMNISNGLQDFSGAEAESKVMRVQTLGGQIIRHDGKGVTEEEQGKPIYFVGAFRENQLHLTKVNGTVQMRPQFHHIDAEDQRTRLQTSRAAAAAAASTGEPPKDAGEQARGLLSRQNKNNEDEKPRQEEVNRRILKAAEAEPWVKMEYVDEDEAFAFQKFNERMFVKDVEGSAKLESAMGVWEYLDAISGPRTGAVRRRRRPRRRRGTNEHEEEDSETGDEEDVVDDGAYQGPNGPAAT